MLYLNFNTVTCYRVILREVQSYITCYRVTYVKCSHTLESVYYC